MPLFFIRDEEKWGLKQDASRVSQPQTIQLLITSYNRRKSRLEVSIDLPFPEDPKKRRKPPVNVIQQALNIKAYMAIHPEQTCLSAAFELNIHRKRISKLMKIIDLLPPTFIEQYKDCDDPKVLHRLSVQQLSRITSSSCPNRISQILNNLQL
ncbi:MAG: hypothetical protein JW734_09450 [Candidatus Omnitrophica bacterium]|nr:hypothetical protein [Candidatus Omnitrophota bacterium]